MSARYLAAGSPNPLVPHWPELIIGAIAFLIVFALLAKVLMPRISATLAERTDADRRRPEARRGRPGRGQ